MIEHKMDAQVCLESCARIMGFVIEEKWKPSVKLHLELLAVSASLINEWQPKEPSEEPAPVFRPGPAQC